LAGNHNAVGDVFIAVVGSAKPKKMMKNAGKNLKRLLDVC